MYKIRSDETRLTWCQSSEHAFKLGAKKDKSILLFFTGSDWSGESMQMKKEVLQDLAFEERVREHFIAFEIDFPKRIEQKQRVKERNEQLKNEYQIASFPTVILLGSDGHEITRLGRFTKEGISFAEMLLSILEKDKTLCQVANALADASHDELKEAYAIAQELQRPCEMHAILEAGLSSPFFLLEKYRLGVESGLAQREEYQTIKKTLLDLDPQNAMGHHLSVAMINFQELAKCATLLTATAQVEPLLGYLGAFGEQDPQNVWRIEMMVAQVFLDDDEWQDAYQHAQIALEKAPLDQRAQIERSLRYIEEQREMSSEEISP